jgi:hypothetical protein
MHNEMQCTTFCAIQYKICTPQYDSLASHLLRRAAAITALDEIGLRFLLLLRAPGRVAASTSTIAAAAANVGEAALGGGI